MTDKLSQLIPKHRTFITDAELKIYFADYSACSRKSKIKTLLTNGELLLIKRGLYGITDKGRPLLHPYELAQYIYGPSYISLESALSFHQLIPEAVYTTTSASSKRANQFNTPIGIFAYAHLPPCCLYTGVELIKQNDYQFLMAKPWKAICDYVYCYKKDWAGLEPLQESLRIELSDLPIISDTELDLYSNYYRNNRIARFLAGIKKACRK